MAKLVLSKTMHSDWFFLGQDFAVRNAVQAVYFCFGAKLANSKFATKTVKKMWILLFFTAKSAEKAKKISKMDEEDEHSLGEFYYPEDLETFDAQTEGGRRP